jgi:hypothetical protein
MSPDLLAMPQRRQALPTMKEHRNTKYQPLTINHQHNPDPDRSLPGMRTVRTATGKASNAAAKPPIPPQSAKAKVYTR